MRSPQVRELFAQARVSQFVQLSVIIPVGIMTFAHSAVPLGTLRGLGPPHSPSQIGRRRRRPPGPPTHTDSDSSQFQIARRRRLLSWLWILRAGLGRCRARIYSERCCLAVHCSRTTAKSRFNCGLRKTLRKLGSKAASTLSLPLDRLSSSFVWFGREARQHRHPCP